MATHRRGVWRTMVVAGSVYFLMKRRKNCWRVAHEDIGEKLVTCRLGCYGTSNSSWGIARHFTTMLHLGTMAAKNRRF
jgi:hypothetical protein